MGCYRLQPSLCVPVLHLLICTACVIPSGCLAPHKVARTETGGPEYSKARLIYRLSQSSTKSGTQFSTTAPGLVDLVSAANDVLEEETAAWETARLEIIYPHPDGNTSTARVVLQLSHDATVAEPAAVSKPLGTRIRQAAAVLPFVDEPADRMDPVTTPEGFENVRMLDIPREQLDLLLVDLAGSGLFEDQKRPDGGTTLDVTLDRGRVRKAWTPEPRLDDLVMRVWREGRRMYLPGRTSLQTEH